MSGRVPVTEMNGLLTVRPNGRFTLGRLFDILLGRQMAQRTFRSFLTELRAFIETEWKTERDMMIW